MFAPQKKPKAIFAPMRQITNSLIERNALAGPGTMFKGKNLNTEEHYLSSGKANDVVSGEPAERKNKIFAEQYAAKNTAISKRNKDFAPAGQTTQMIIGAGGETDRSILTTSENLYHTFKMKKSLLFRIYTGGKLTYTSR